MMRKNYLRVFLLNVALCLTILSKAQSVSSTFDLPNIVQPSPNASAMARYGEIPVSPQTGVPDINVPLYQLKSKKISLPISVSYHASGVKVTDMASTVGLGWVLNAGGAITRVRQGVYDEQQNGFYNIIFPDENDPAKADKEKDLAGRMTIPLYRNINKTDGQPDIFYFNIGSKSGKFMFKNKLVKGLPPEVITIPYTPMKINFSSDWGSIEIIDVDGTRYIFGKSLAGEDCREQTSYSSSASDPESTDHTTSWYLADIIAANNTDTVSFKYDIPYGSQFITSPKTLVEDYSDDGDPTEHTYYSPGQIDHSSFTHSNLLSEIKFNNGNVLFKYSDEVNGIKKLDTVIINSAKSSGPSLYKVFVFYGSRFKNSNVEVSSANCLRLDSLKEMGNLAGITLPPYKFYYNSYDAYEVPPFNTKSQDLWGYFNGKSNSDLLLVQPTAQVTYSPPVSKASGRKGDSSYMQVGMLKKIEYPTMGNTEFFYEPNQIIRNYLKYDTSFNYLGQHISTFDALPNSTSYSTVNFNISGPLLAQLTPSGVSYNVHLQFTGSKQCPSPGFTNCQLNEPTVILKDITTGLNVIQSQLTELNGVNPPSLAQRDFYLTLDYTHAYQLSFKDPVSISSYSQRFTFRLDATIDAKYSDMTITSTPMSETVFAGGLRIKNIISSNTQGGSTIKEYKYTKPYFNSTVFQGDFDALALSVYGFDTYKVIGFGYAKRLALRTYSENLTVPLGSNNCSVSYEEVEESQKDLNNNPLGKTVYTYNKSEDEVPGFMPFYKVDNSHLRSQLLSKKIFQYKDGTFKLLSEERTAYKDLTNADPANSYKVKFYLVHQLFDDCTYTCGYFGTSADDCLGTSDIAGNGANAVYRMEPFWYNTTKFVVDSTTNIRYDENGQNPLTVITKYSYGNLIHLLPTQIQVIRSDGKISIKTIQYVQDVNLGESCTSMCQSNFYQQLNTQKASLFSSQSEPWTRWLNYQGLREPEGYSIIYPDSVVRAKNDFLACQASYENAVLQLIANKNSCEASYNVCLQNYYATASEDIQALADLRVKHIIASPILEQSFVDNTLATTQKTIYKTFANQYTDVSKVQLAIEDNPLKDKIEFSSYDASGNIKEQKKANDISQVYIWSYNNAYPIAMVQNASYGNVAFTSFESSETDNWSGIVSSNIQSSVGITGGKFYSQANFNINKNGLQSTNTYIVSYWSKSGSYSISGTQSGYPKNVKSILIDGQTWTLYEHLVSGQTTISVLGSGAIDELRLYPVGSLMTTYTYEPLIGMTSQTDANNQTIYYEYDALGRLKLIKDRDGNIIKTIDYKYQNQ